VWQCCNCPHSAGMHVLSTPVCPNCDHQICTRCHQEVVKLPSTR
jgi:hypothetical protein